MDTRLRELERAALAAPHDAAANRALARACEQAGDARRGWSIWCRLARDGDLDAWDALERRPVGLRRQPEIQAFAALEAGLSPVPGTGRRELVLSGRILQAITSDELEPLWTTDLTVVGGASLACGPWIVHEHGGIGERRLVVRDGATGLEAARTALVNDNTLSRNLVHLLGTADRVVAYLGGGGRGVLWGGWGTIIDLGDRIGEVLGELPRDVRLLDVAANLVFLKDQHGVVRTRARPIEGGDDRWTSAETLVAVDARGALLANNVDEVTAVDTRSGAVCWQASNLIGEWSAGGAVWLQAVVRPRGGASGPPLLREVRALARADGRELWRARDRLAGQRLLTLAMADDVAYLAVEGEGDRRTVMGLDLLTGELLFVHGLTPKTGPGPVGLVPLEQGLVVVTQDRSRTRLERLG